MNTLSVGSLTLLHMILLLQQGTGQRRNLPLGKLAAHKSPTMAGQGGIGLACPLWLGGNEAVQRGGEDVRIASLPAGLWDNNHWQELGTSAQVSKLVLLQGTVGRIHPQRAKYNQKVATFM